MSGARRSLTVVSTRGSLTDRAFADPRERRQEIARYGAPHSAHMSLPRQSAAAQPQVTDFQPIPRPYISLGRSVAKSDGRLSDSGRYARDCLGGQRNACRREVRNHRALRHSLSQHVVGPSAPESLADRGPVRRVRFRPVRIYSESDLGGFRAAVVTLPSREEWRSGGITAILRN